MQNIQLIADKLIETLYLKTYNNLRKEYDPKIIGSLIGLDFAQTTTIIDYLEDKGLILNDKLYGRGIKLNAAGIDKVLSRREKKLFKYLTFTNYRYIPSSRDAVEFIYSYVISDDIDSVSTMEQNQIKVGISGSAVINWGVNIWSNDPSKDYRKVEKILFLYGIDMIAEKMKEGTLNDEEEIMLLSTNNLNKFGPDSFLNFDIVGYKYEVEIGEKMLNEEIKENKLAALIIETRDTINSIFYQQHSEKLLLLNEERNLLDFFKSAKTEEEFSHRLASLGQISRNLNTIILRKITNETDTQLGSVILLSKFLLHIGSQNNFITDTLKNIGRIRQGYPMHTDISGVINSYKYFNIGYPVNDFQNAWNILLIKYNEVLQQLKNILIEKYLNKD